MILKKIRNNFPISNEKYQLVDRLMTFDAPDHSVQIGSVWVLTLEKVQNSFMTKAIQESIESIANVNIHSQFSNFTNRLTKALKSAK